MGLGSPSSRKFRFDLLLIWPTLPITYIAQNPIHPLADFFFTKVNQLKIKNKKKNKKTQEEASIIFLLPPLTCFRLRASIS
jgi:hypothetical protein